MDNSNKNFQAEAQRLADTARDRAADAFEDIKVASNGVVDKVRELIEEGNVRRISLRKGDRTLFEIPLTVGVGAGAAALFMTPALAAVGAIVALVSDVTIAVERDVEATAEQAASNVADAAKDAASSVKDAASSAKDAASGSTPSSSVADSSVKTVGKPDAGSTGA